MLGIAPSLFRPSLVVDLYFRGSSDFLTFTTAGISEFQTPRLFSRTYTPFVPSLNDRDTGVIGSSVKVVHPVKIEDVRIKVSVMSIFIKELYVCF